MAEPKSTRRTNQQRALAALAVLQTARAEMHEVDALPIGLEWSSRLVPARRKLAEAYNAMAKVCGYSDISPEIVRDVARAAVRDAATAFSLLVDRDGGVQ